MTGCISTCCGGCSGKERFRRFNNVAYCLCKPICDYCIPSHKLLFYRWGYFHCIPSHFYFDRCNNFRYLPSYKLYIYRCIHFCCIPSYKLHVYICSYFYCIPSLKLYIYMDAVISTVYRHTRFIYTDILSSDGNSCRNKTWMTVCSDLLHFLRSLAL